MDRQVIKKSNKHKLSQPALFLYKRSHDLTPRLLTLFHVAFFLLLPQHHTLPPLDALNCDKLTANAVPPPEPLYHATVGVVNADRPLATADLNLRVVMREVEFGEEDLCRHRLCCC